MKDYQAIIRQVCSHLAGKWFYHDLKSEGDHLYIHDRNGVFIRFSLDVYGCKIPQLSICYADPRAKDIRLVTVAKIGCSLDKGVYSITSSIEKRLFCYLVEARSQLHDEIMKLRARKGEQEAREQIIAALGNVFALEKHQYSRTYQTYDLAMSQDSLKASSVRVHHEAGIDNFSVKIDGLTLDKLMKIAHIVYSE